MQDYELYMEEYDRFDDIDYSTAYALISRGVLDNACRESIVYLWEDGTVDSCGILEQLSSEIKNPEILKWIGVARVRSEWYLNMEHGDDPYIEWEFFDSALVMTWLGQFAGMMRILVGFQIADQAIFSGKNDIENINALFEFAWYRAKVESSEIRDDHVLFSMGISMEHTPADPIERMIDYFNTPTKSLYHKYYCNNNTHPEWQQWTDSVTALDEKVPDIR
jgi:hypothetical protein